MKEKGTDIENRVLLFHNFLAFCAVYCYSSRTVYRLRNGEYMAEETFSEVSFEEMEIKPEIRRAVQEMGFEKMTPIQAQAIPALLKGGDVIGQAQTGTGKTAAFGIPVLERIDPENKNLQAIILCPTRELAVQAAGELRAFAQFMHGVKMLPVYGGQDITRQIQGLKGTQVVIGTPGRVMDHMRRHTIRMDHVSMVVLDEADEMLDMGFREDMEVILGAIEQPHQTCLFSATMPQAIMNLANQFQNDPELIKITAKELTTANIQQYYYPVKWEYKNLALLRLLDYYQYKRCVIFCNTKSMVDALAELLQKSGYVAEGLHGDLSQKQRDSVMGRFRSGRLSILIATDIAARGIDVDDVEAVFNYDLPSEAEYYVHRIGRTGRAGREGTAHTLCRNRDFRKLHEIEGICHATMEERKIPSVEKIRGVRESAAMESVMSTHSEGNSEVLIPLIRTYCQANDISIEEFAAAALRMQLGETKREGDDIDVDIPARNASRPNREERRRKFMNDKRDRERRGFGSDRRERGERGERGDRERRSFSGERRERGERTERGDRERRSYGGERREKGKFGFRKEGVDKSFTHDDRKKNRERSRSILKKAEEDLRMGRDTDSSYSYKKRSRKSER